MAVSLDTPLDNEDGSAETIGDMQEDRTAAQGFEKVQQGIWVEQLHNALEMGLQQLPEDEYTVIRARYYEGKTRREIGPKARQTEERALKYLRRGWTSKSHEEAENGYGNGLNNIWEALNNLKVTHEGNLYKIEIVNPVEYASYVEYGHRTANHKGWVPGKFMLTLSEDYIRNIAPQLLEQRIKEFLMQYFG